MKIFEKNYTMHTSSLCVSVYKPVCKTIEDIQMLPIIMDFDAFIKN
jgi:hypothetical protein